MLVCWWCRWLAMAWNPLGQPSAAVTPITSLWCLLYMAIWQWSRLCPCDNSSSVCFTGCGGLHFLQQTDALTTIWWKEILHWLAVSFKVICGLGGRNDIGSAVCIASPLQNEMAKSPVWRHWSHLMEPAKQSKGMWPMSININAHISNVTSSNSSCGVHSTAILCNHQHPAWKS